ncbi:MAG: hypothetical protein WC796_03150 [Candidatus Pacearchaeota archaeon]|jgi:cytochrome oxidase assembly protein ShyY1
MKLPKITRRQFLDELRVLGLTALIGSACIAEPQIERAVKSHRQIKLDKQSREAMFNQGYALPKATEQHQTKTPQDQLAVYRRVCIEGRYNPAEDAAYVNRTEAERLLKEYGWISKEI